LKPLLKKVTPGGLKNVMKRIGVFTAHLSPTEHPTRNHFSEKSDFQWGKVISSGVFKGTQMSREHP
jgi:hypothetical protein